ncbi:MAG TPA: NAD(P)-dependent oxidoreductase [Terriglobia bacterium]|nr:NAD(P)-dependent oxidoreductase [Terriglobia bacterium]
MKVLLTGATGIIGPDVLTRLLARGDDVCVLARPDTMDKIKHRDRIEVVAGDLSDTKALEKATQGCEIVYHLAGLTIGAGLRELTDVNVIGTEKLLRACEAAEINRFVFLSSVAVYAPAPTPNRWPVTEERAIRAYGNPNLKNYAQSKIDAEKEVLRFQGKGKFDCTILRSAPVYSKKAPRIRELVERLIQNPWQAVNPRSREVRMHWVHIHDLSKAVVLAGNRRAAANQIFNIAGPDVFTAATILALVKGFPAEDLFEARLSDAGTLKYDITKANRILGYTPKVRLESGLRELASTMNEWPRRPRFRRSPISAQAWRRSRGT